MSIVWTAILDSCVSVNATVPLALSFRVSGAAPLDFALQVAKTESDCTEPAQSVVPELSRFAQPASDIDDAYDYEIPLSQVGRGFISQLSLMDCDGCSGMYSFECVRLVRVDNDHTQLTLSKTGMYTYLHANPTRWALSPNETCRLPRSKTKIEAANRNLDEKSFAAPTASQDLQRLLNADLPGMDYVSMEVMTLLQQMPPSPNIARPEYLDVRV
ncbi:hypothetical protein SeLEV6574_g07725 [Synchytrium endobioticum]|uniref:Uncharacterized protein n=1 Tax=Synchytrium endobioticum TaxID=286115 RepID=A0A507CAK9_9FUNG|nr:hypothetical protein SeLEV6574_g07725 [Synchytrium endobioticum]